MEYLWKNRATAEERQAENRKHIEADKLYFDLVDSLPDEQRDIINEQSDRLSRTHSAECDFYYSHGFLDGLKAAKAMMDVE